jgi:uncharacterized repeat protein (TIGR03803 family)
MLAAMLVLFVRVAAIGFAKLKTKAAMRRGDDVILDKRSGKLLCSVFFLCALPVVGQTFSVLANYSGTQQGGNSLVQAADGNLYGTTVYGGTADKGTVYRITTAGTMTTLYNFCSLSACADGSEPFFGLTLGTDGNLYGTTNFGGTDNFGTIFKITLNGTLTTLHSFDNDDGCTPQGGVMLANNGFFYGTTLNCGATDHGTLFAIKPNGAFHTLYNFRRDSLHGGNPYTAPMQASDGNLYGVTYDGGVSDGGVVYKVTPSNAVSNIYNFCSLPDCGDGFYPLGGLAEGSDGNLYGTTADGINSCGDGQGCGGVFRMTTSGVFTGLHAFVGSDGEIPIAVLTLGNDGVFYSTTSGGGTSPIFCFDGCGTIYSMTVDGTFTSLYNFCSLSDCLDGYDPGDGPLFQETNGTFYSTTPYGGTAGVGTVFTWSEGLPAFVTPNPAAGVVGSRVTILGNNLSGATSVSFNGTAATFTAARNAIVTAVPAGATTGAITVTLPSSTLTSKIDFTVEP